MKYAVITPKKYAELHKEDKIASEPRFSQAIEAGFSGFFKENYKDGIPFVTDIAANDITITDTTETPDIRISDTEERVEINEQWVFKEMDDGEVHYVKQVIGTIGESDDQVRVKGEITHEAELTSQDIEDIMREEIIHATAREAREKHFKELQDSTSIPFLMKLKKVVFE